MLVRLVRWKNAEPPMAVTGIPSIVSGITTTSAEPLYRVIVTRPLLIAYEKSAAGLTI